MRVRYWRLSVNDLLNSTYPQEKVNHWEIKCLQGEYEHFGVFWFRYGTPFDKELINGISFYYNDISQEKVKELQSHLADYEKVKKFTLMPAEFDINTGEITPTLKVKRNVVIKKYADIIEKMY